jgi:hypothetical protein
MLQWILLSLESLFIDNNQSWEAFDNVVGGKGIQSLYVYKLEDVCYLLIVQSIKLLEN